MDRTHRGSLYSIPIFEMSSLALAVSGGALALVSLLLKRASERDTELLREMSVSSRA